MCARYTHSKNFPQIAKQLGLREVLPQEPRYNIAPSQLVACVRTTPDNGHREVTMLKWGLVPSWAKHPATGNKMINARGETVAEKPSFRSAFKKRRCLLLADGFYEWKREGKAKQPYYVRFKDHRAFAFAGLWERWEKQDPAIESCGLITTSPNAVLEPIHDRMPVILDPNDYDMWLDGTVQDSSILNGVLRPYPPEEMEA